MDAIAPERLLEHVGSMGGTLGDVGSEAAGAAKEAGRRALDAIRSPFGGGSDDD